MSEVGVDVILRLRDRIRSCTSCPLHEVSQQRVPWSGTTPTPLAVLGQAPGWHEDKDGRPFVGPAGNMLKATLRKVGLDPTTMAYLNPVCCYPGRGGGGDKRPMDSALDACSQNMWEQISVIQPAILVLAGEVALHRFYPKLKLAHVHGKPLFWSGREHGRPVWWRDTGSMYLFSTYHPSSALRSVKAEGMFIDDMKKLAAFTATEAWPEECYVCGKEVSVFDPSGFARCELHDRTQMVLPGVGE